MRIVVSALAAALAGAFVLLGVARSGGQASAEPPLPAFDRAHSDLDPAGARAFRGFATYSVGEEHAGLALTAITHREPERGADRSEYFSFLYGSCRPPPGAGCALPLEIQIWPACVRTLGDYRLTPFSNEPPPHERLTVRGVPAAFFRESERLARLELYTGRVTIVLFGSGQEQLLDAAAALRGVNVEHAAAGDPLPRPAAGAMAGELECG